LYKKNLSFCKKMFDKGIFEGKIDLLHQFAVTIFQNLRQGGLFFIYKSESKITKLFSYFNLVILILILCARWFCALTRLLTVCFSLRTGLYGMHKTIPRAV
jgi:hypothetical protein